MKQNIQFLLLGLALLFAPSLAFGQGSPIRKATSAEALAATNDSAYMTALKTAQALGALGGPTNGITKQDGFGTNTSLVRPIFLTPQTNNLGIYGNGVGITNVSVNLVELCKVSTGKTVQYTHITNAFNNVSAGDTIIVRSGSYDVYSPMNMPVGSALEIKPGVCITNWVVLNTNNDQSAGSPMLLPNTSTRIINHGIIVDAGLLAGWTNVQQCPIGLIDSSGATPAYRGATNYYVWAGKIIGLSECFSIETTNVCSGKLEGGDFHTWHSAINYYNANHVQEIAYTRVMLHEPDPNLLTRGEPRRSLYLFANSGKTMLTTVNFCSFDSDGTTNDSNIYFATGASNYLALNSCTFNNSGATNKIKGVINQPTGIYLNGTPLTDADILNGTATAALQKIDTIRIGSMLNQQSTQPTLRYVGGSSTRTNAVIQNLNGTTYLYWGNGATLWSNALNPVFPTFTSVTATTLTNTGTAYIPTNTAPWSLDTNDFVMNTVYTNSNQRATVSCSVALLNTLTGTDTARVTLMRDQNQDGTFEQRQRTIENSLTSVQPVTLLISGVLQPGAAWYLTNLCSGSGVAAIQAGSCDIAR